MAWTAPMTATANTAFTAAQFNTYVRDNLNETAPAKATTAGAIFVATGANAIAQRIPTQDTVAASQSTTSSSFANLATTGPAVTVTTGTKAIVGLAAAMSNSATNAAALMSFAVSGATTIAATDDFAIEIDGINGGQDQRQGASWLLTTLTAGSNVFTAKYRAGSSTATFANRHLYVIPL